MILFALALRHFPRPSRRRLIRFGFVVIGVLVGGVLHSLFGEPEYRPRTADAMVEAEHANRASLPPGGKRRP